ncbi:hypothetical protein KJ564_11000, partial [bacterium]|nr:hypothetical protein [bacterium]
MDRNKSFFILVVLAALLLFAALSFGSARGKRALDGQLTRSWSDILLPAGQSLSDKVDRFLQENRALLGLSDDEDVRFNLVKIDEIGLGTRFVYQQHAHGLPVFETNLIVTANDAKIKSLFNAFSTSDFALLKPNFSANEALASAEQQISGSLYRSEPSVELGYDRQGDLVYRLQLPGIDPPADWEIWVNAVNGEILRHVDRRIFIDGTGQIFNPDPKTVLEDNTLTDQNDSNAAIPIEAYSDVILLDLDDPVGGYYYLDGSYVSTFPTSNRAAETTTNFIYLREDDRFEEVMVYYHIDNIQRYFQNELQTPNANNRQQPCNVNGTTEDNSWYSPFNGQITYGSGGVDDAEDADVILHEYGHAMHDNMVFNWSGGHTGAMGEGYGDYLAGSYSLSINQNFQPYWVFNWDGHNQFWAGRILNAPFHYPEDANTGNIYHGGELWSASLMDVWWEIPDVIAWDRIILQHHFLIGYGALMEDAAEAILTTELALFNGFYRQIIVDNFEARGLILPSAVYPQIAHEPLGDSEDTLAVEFEILADITSNIPLDGNSLQLFWRADQGSYASVLLDPTGNPSEYLGVIPGPFNGQTISYYLTAADTLGFASFLPDSAPASVFQFYVGPDPYPPEVVWTDSLGESVFPTVSYPVKAVVTDNYGIQSVELRWQVGSGNWQSTAMYPAGVDTFEANLTYSQQPLDQIVQYFVRAVDSSSMNNTTDGPTQFFPLGPQANLEDFEGQLAAWYFTGDWGLNSLFAHSGSNSIEDSPYAQYPNGADSWAEWGQSWDLSSFETVTLTFWEKHLLEENADFGYLEISSSGAPWESILEISGVENEWFQRNVNLETYCGFGCDDIRFRFRTVTDEQTNFIGWFIDDLSITVELIVPVA